MRAAILSSAPGRLEFVETVLDEPGPREVIVSTRAVGLCHSDLHYIDGVWRTDLPEVLGHEASGEVVAVGELVTSIRPGDRVVTCLTAHCGRCRACLTGRLVLCENHGEIRRRDRPALTLGDGTAVGRMGGIGAFAERMLVHESSVVAIGSGIDWAPASLLGCSIVTGLGAVIRGAHVVPGSSVAVIGCGGVGLSVIQGARIAGAADIIAIDLLDESLEMARRYGATATVNASECDPVEAVRGLTEGGADFVFEVIGLASTVEQGMAMLRRGGVATVLGMVPADTPISVNGADLFFDEKTIRGSFMGSSVFPVDIPRYVDLYRDGRLLLDEMVSATVSFDEINEGFDALRSGGSARIVVTMDADS